MKVTQDFGDAFADAYSGSGKEICTAGGVFCGKFDEALEGTR